MKTNYLVGYDIANDKRLRKVAKLMQEFGQRIQYSFFHCLISNRQKKHMIKRILKIIDSEEDQVLIIPMTEKQLNQIECVGLKQDLTHYGIIIV